jgi:hypothetical protein
LDYGYSKDKKQVYYKNRPLKNSDPSSFMLVHYRSDLAKDNNQVYIWGKVIDGADPNSFEVFDFDYFSRDKDNLYISGQVMRADPNNFNREDFYSY